MHSAAGDCSDRLRMQTIATDHLPWLPHSLLAVSVYATVCPSPTSSISLSITTPSNFDSSTLMSVLHVSEAGACHFVYINIDSNVAQKDALAKKSYLLVHMLIARASIHTSIKSSSICEKREQLARKKNDLDLSVRNHHPCIKG